MIRATTLLLVWISCASVVPEIARACEDRPGATRRLPFGRWRVARGDSWSRRAPAVRDTWVDVPDAIAWDLIEPGRSDHHQEPARAHRPRFRREQNSVAAKPAKGGWSVFEGDPGEKGVVHEHKHDHHDHDHHEHDGHDHHDHDHAKK